MCINKYKSRAKRGKIKKKKYVYFKLRIYVYIERVCHVLYTHAHTHILLSTLVIIFYSNYISVDIIERYKFTCCFEKIKLDFM